MSKTEEKTVGSAKLTGNGKAEKNYRLPPHFLEQKVSDDGKAYVEVSFKGGVRCEKIVFKVGEQGVDSHWMQVVADLDREEISNEIDASRLSSWGFSSADAAGKGAAYIHSHATAPEIPVHDLAFPEEKEMTPLEILVRRVVEDCTPKQKFVAELRLNRQHPVAFNVIAELFEEEFCSPITDEGVRKLYSKVEQKVCNALGVPYPRKRDRNAGV